MYIFFRTVYLLIKVVHHLIIATGRIDLGDQARLQFVHELAEDDTISQSIFVIQFYKCA